MVLFLLIFLMERRGPGRDRHINVKSVTSSTMGEYAWEEGYYQEMGSIR